MVAGAILLSREDLVQEGDGRLEALLTVAHLRRPTQLALSHVRKARHCWREGDQSLAAIAQADRQLAASEGRPLTWYFDEKPVADVMARAFADRGLDIAVKWVPMPRDKK